MSNRATSAGVARAAARDQLRADHGEWAALPGPVYQRLARGIAGAVERGELAHGARLPSERALAPAAWVSRGTVVAAYDVLVGEGLAERRVGSGTYVIGGAAALPRGREGSELVARLAGRADERPDVIDLSISVLDDPRGLPHVAVSTSDLAAEVPASGYDPRGHHGLREALASSLTADGLDTTADDLVVTTGAQQAISLAAACWVRPGDVVVVEDPTYPGALAAFRAAGAVLRGVPVDRDGVVVDALDDALRDRPALVYLQSGPHNPTGALLTSGRRREVAAIVARSRVPLVEDGALRHLGHHRAAPPIASHAPEHPMALVGSLAKRFWSGIRVGYVRAPRPVVARLGRIKTTHDLGSSTLDQLAAARLLAHPDTPAFLRARDQELRRRHDLVDHLVAEHLPAWRLHPSAGGLSRWVRLPAPVGARFSAHALAHGVAIAPAGSLSAGDGHADHVRLSVTVDQDGLRTGIARLAEAWATFPAGTHGGSGSP